MSDQERVRVLNKIIKEWKTGADWPNEFDAIKWQLSEDDLCKLSQKCEECVIFECTGAMNCDSIISEALNSYDDWLPDKDGPSFEEWRKDALGVVKYFEGILAFEERDNDL